MLKEKKKKKLVKLLKNLNIYEKYSTHTFKIRKKKSRIHLNA